MPPDMHETKPAVITVAANVQAATVSQYLYDPDTNAYIGVLRLDKSTDHQVVWGDPEKPVESLDDPRVANETPVDPRGVTDATEHYDVGGRRAGIADIAKILGQSRRAETNAERLSYAQLAAAEIAYTQVIDALTPRRWISSDKWDAAAVTAPAEAIAAATAPAVISCDTCSTIIGAQRAEIGRLRATIAQREALDESRRAGSRALFDELEKGRERIRVLEADVERLTAARRAKPAWRSA